MLLPMMNALAQQNICSGPPEKNAYIRCQVIKNSSFVYTPAHAEIFNRITSHVPVRLRL
jgi:hypothetical protein